MISAKECFLVFLSLINMLLPRQVMIYACCGRLEPQHSTLLCRKKKGCILCTCINESNVTIVMYPREWQAHKAMFTYYYDSTDTETRLITVFFSENHTLQKHSCFLPWHNLMLRDILFYLCGWPKLNNMKWRENDMWFSNFLIFRRRYSMTLIRLESK